MKAIQILTEKQYLDGIHLDGTLGIVLHEDLERENQKVQSLMEQNQALKAQIEHNRQLMQQQPQAETIDLTDNDAELDTQARNGTKRSFAAALGERLAAVKKEKVEAAEEVEDQRETTLQTALILDKWQSYADELKKQVRELNGQPLAWEDFVARNH